MRPYEADIHTLKKMNLSESIQVIDESNFSFRIIRVPGGWIYKFEATSIFVKDNTIEIR